MSGNRKLTTKCPVCGRPLSVLTRQAPAPHRPGEKAPASERPGERVEVPIGNPICPAGHVYRLAAAEPYPD